MPNPYTENVANRANLIAQQQARAAARQTAKPDPRRWVLLYDLYTDPSVQVRTKGLSMAKVQEYAQAMIDYGGWGDFPPIEAVRVDGRIIIADGAHRREAALLANKLQGGDFIVEVPVIVRPGGLWEAFVYGAENNVRHGLPLTKADKQNYLQMRMHPDAPEELSWRGMADNAIAPLLGVTNKTVSAWREALGLTWENSQVTGADGRTYNTGKVKRAAKKRAMSDVEKAQRAVVKGLHSAAKSLEQLGDHAAAQGYFNDAETYREEWELD